MSANFNLSSSFFQLDKGQREASSGCTQHAQAVLRLSLIVSASDCESCAPPPPLSSLYLCSLTPLAFRAQLYCSCCLWESHVDGPEEIGLSD